METRIGQEGKRFPFGATLAPKGPISACSPSIVPRRSSCCSTTWTPRGLRVIDLDPRANHTNHYWHVFVPGVIAGQVDAYRVAGPFDPARGLR
jgi:glycogen operon protein